MPHVRLILALHNHQPVGNFGSVFEEAYRTSYLPFLETIERYPKIPIAIHTSGPLLEWLADERPEYIERLKARAASGALEIIGGAFYEPILPMIPPRDRLGQIRTYRTHLEELFETSVRGLWLAERVWEQSLASAIVDAGAAYTILDDVHFERAGVAGDRLTGYYLTEDDGRLLRVFPASETLRYTMPFQEPHQTYLFLRSIAERRDGATVVFADDGEKFGAWPNTYNHVYTNGWLTHFCDMLEANRDWIEPVTPARVLEETLPEGKIYLPDGSYREMTEWALDLEPARMYRTGKGRLEHQDNPAAIKRFFRPGGFWRNFKIRYPETDEMYARMMLVSRRLETALGDANADPDYLEVARRELHRGQCNCPYWHGSFGGIYLPHLRGAIYRALISADVAIDDALGGRGDSPTAEAGDFNLDGRQEVRLDSQAISVFIRPAQGGHVYELDDRRVLTNLLATLERRPEIGHDAVRNPNGEGLPTSSQPVVLKQEGLERLLCYDRLPRKAFVDHFLRPDASLEQLVDGSDYDQGDFAAGAYLSRIRREPGRSSVVMERKGRAAGAMIRIRKTLSIAAGSTTLLAHYELEDLPAGTPLHFAVEINLAGMAGHAPDRLYEDPKGTALGMLDTRITLAETSGITLRDQWLDLAATLEWTTPAALWCFPIESVSLSEGGFERVYQSSAVVPHWTVLGDELGKWSTTISLTLNPAHASTNRETRLVGQIAAT